MQVLIVFNSMYTRKNELMAASSHAPDGIAYQCMYKILYNLTNLGYQLCNYKYFEFGNTSCHKTRLPCKKTNNMLQNYSMGEVASSSLLVGTHSRISICTYIYTYYIILYFHAYLYQHTKGVSRKLKEQSQRQIYVPLVSKHTVRLHCTAGLSTEFPFSDSSILLSPNSSLLLVAHHIAHIQTNKYSTSQHAGTILKYSHTHYILLQYHAVPCRAIQGAGSKSKSRIGRKVFFVKSGNVWNTTP